MIATVLIVIVALLHTFFLVLEMFLWTTPRVRRIFGQTAEQAEITKVLAANQGLYNGFLAAGLLWGLTQGLGGNAVTTFFLLCVFIAGLYGAATANPRILLVQSLPAALALGASLLSL